MLVKRGPPYIAFRGVASGEGIAVVLPGVGGVAVSSDLPVSRLILIDECDLSQPLRALPPVPLRDDESHRPAVLQGEGLAGVAECEKQRIGPQDFQPPGRGAPPI